MSASRTGLPAAALAAVALCAAAALAPASAAPQAAATGGGTETALSSARGLLESGDAAAAVAILEPLAESGGAEDGVLQLLGVAYSLAGRPGEALRTLRPIVEAGRADAAILFGAARAARALGRREEARSWLARSLELEPVSPAALHLAEMLEEDGDAAGVRSVLAPLTTGAAAARLAEAAPPLALEAHRRFARTCLAQDLPAEAVASLQAVTALSPGDASAWRLLGETLLELERIDQSYEALSKAQQLEEAGRRQRLAAAESAEGTGGSVAELIESAHRAQQAGDGEAALELLRDAMQQAPSDPRPRILEIRLLIGLRRPAEALPRADTLVRMAPDHPEGYYLRGMTRLSMQDLESAERDLGRALELEPSHLAALNGLAILLISRGDDEAAERVLLDLLSSWPDDELGRRNLARVRQRLGRP